MKRLTALLSIVAFFCIISAASATNKAAISSNVDTIVAGIDSGQDVSTLKADAYEPYAFVMKETGEMIIHPTLAGKSLKEQAAPVYQALMQATQEGVWVEYEWQGKMKHTYAKKTKENLIVGSGY